MVGYQPSFRLAGGINLPKIITCRCSDGVDRRQLVKVSGGGGIFLTCKVCGRKLENYSVPSLSLFLFVLVSVPMSLHALIPLFVSRSGHSGSAGSRRLRVSVTARSLQAYCERVKSESMGNAGSKHTNG